MNAVAFLDPVQTLVFSPLPVASCRSRDPVRRLLKGGQGRAACILPLSPFQKVPGFTCEQHEMRRVEGKAPLPRAEKKRALLLLKEAAVGDIFAFAFSARRARAPGIVTRKGQDKSLIWLGSLSE